MPNILSAPVLMNSLSSSTTINISSYPGTNCALKMMYFSVMPNWCLSNSLQNAYCHKFADIAISLMSKLKI